MRTLRMLLLFMLGSFWQPSEALAIVQTVPPMTATTQQAIPATPQKQTRIEKRLQQSAQYQAARRGLNGDASQWLWYAIGFFVVALIVSLLKVLASLSGIFWAIAVVCLAIWALKFFGIL
jgi:Flp pilus assembly protein TadB